MKTKDAIGDETISNLLKECDAWQTGHFLLSSGLHSNQYMQCQKMLQYPSKAMILARELANRVLKAGHKVQAVIGPALGAIHLELLVGLALNEITGDDSIKAMFAERPDGNEFQIRRGMEIMPKEKILVVEDVTTTGGSAKKVVDLVKKLGGEPIAVGAIIDRSGGKVDFGIPFISLITLNLETYSATDCPWCKQGIPVIKPGSTKI